MGMKALEEIRYMLCDELEDIAKKGELSNSGMEYLHKVVDTLKNIDKIEMLEGSGYSHDGDWEAEMRGNYGRGSSYMRDGDHDGYSGARHRNAMGQYSRRRGYSRDEAKDELIEKLEDKIDETSDGKMREAINRCIEVIKKM